jgi:hypothetical protein
METAPREPILRDMTAARHRPALLAFAWTAVFIVWHAYWALGGDFGFGDQESGFPDAGWAFAVVVSGMFAAGLAVPVAVARGVGPRRVLTGLLWAGAAVLALRGLSGLADDLLRFSGAAETGLTGLSDEQVLGTAEPSAYTIWSTVGIDAFFALGGAVFAFAAGLRLPRPTLAWAGYAAFAWAIAYALGVRLYQGLGGTAGIAGTYADPEAMRRASLIAGAVIFAVGVGALAFVRPWGLRLPRWLVIVPALVGSAYSMAHALTAYITKPLDALGVVELQFRGWAERHERAQFLWDLLFYEPWFLLLGVFVTLGAIHHHRRTGGTHERALLAGTAAATLALTAVACGMVVTR